MLSISTPVINSIIVRKHATLSVFLSVYNCVLFQLLRGGSECGAIIYVVGYLVTSVQCGISHVDTVVAQTSLALVTGTVTTADCAVLQAVAIYTFLSHPLCLLPLLPSPALPSLPSPLSHSPPPPSLTPLSPLRLLDLQAADYTSVPSANFSPSPLFGSQLVMMSLEAEQKRGQLFCTVCIHVLMRDEKEGRSKQSQTNNEKHLESA